MRSRSRSNSLTSALVQFTKRRATTPISVPPPTPTVASPLPPPTRQNSNATSHPRRLHLHLPQLFRMHPWQRPVYSDPEMTSEDSALDLDAFVWDSADEKSPIVQSQPQLHDLANHIGNKILQSFELDLDLDTFSSSSSSSSSSGSASGSENDSESECSDSTVTRSPSHSSTSSTPLDSLSSKAATLLPEAQTGASGLTPPWWHYSLRRKVYGAEDEDARPHTERRELVGMLLDDSVGRWPDQEGNRFMF